MQFTEFLLSLLSLSFQEDISFPFTNELLSQSPATFCFGGRGFGFSLKEQRSHQITVCVE